MPALSHLREALHVPFGKVKERNTRVPHPERGATGGGQRHFVIANKNRQEALRSFILYIIYLFINCCFFNFLFLYKSKSLCS